MKAIAVGSTLFEHISRVVLAISHVLLDQMTRHTDFVVRDLKDIGLICVRCLTGT